MLLKMLSILTNSKDDRSLRKQKQKRLRSSLPAQSPLGETAEIRGLRRLELLVKHSTMQPS